MQLKFVLSLENNWTSPLPILFIQKYKLHIKPELTILLFELLFEIVHIEVTKTIKILFTNRMRA